MISTLRSPKYPNVTYSSRIGNWGTLVDYKTMTMINCLTCAPERYEHDEADCGVDGVGGDHLPVDPGQVGSVLRHCLGRHAVLGPLVVAALIQSGAGGVPVLDTH